MKNYFSGNLDTSISVYLSLLSVLFFALFLTSCEQYDAISPSMAKNSSGNNGGGKVTAPDVSLVTSVGTTDSYTACGEPLVADFLAGQHILAGQVTIANDEEFLYVTFATSDGWLFGKTHLYVGPQELLPVNKKGNPKIGNFPNSTTHETLADEYTYVFELNDLGECFMLRLMLKFIYWGGKEKLSSRKLPGQTATK